MIWFIDISINIIYIIIASEINWNINGEEQTKMDYVLHWHFMFYSITNHCDAKYFVIIIG